jgi:hypothetical protein
MTSSPLLPQQGGGAPASRQSAAQLDALRLTRKTHQPPRLALMGFFARRAKLSAARIGALFRQGFISLRNY